MYQDQVSWPIWHSGSYDMMLPCYSFHFICLFLILMINFIELNILKTLFQHLIGITLIDKTFYTFCFSGSIHYNVSLRQRAHHVRTAFLPFIKFLFLSKLEIITNSLVRYNLEKNCTLYPIYQNCNILQNYSVILQTGYWYSLSRYWTVPSPQWWQVLTFYSQTHSPFCPWPGKE